MGMKLSLILGGLLFVTIAGSGWYINYLNDQISILKGNQIVLEIQIQEQNESIKRYLEQLALAKPGLMQSKINKASARVMTTLEKLTNPNQFDEKPITN